MHWVLFQFLSPNVQADWSLCIAGTNWWTSDCPFSHCTPFTVLHFDHQRFCYDAIDFALIFILCPLIPARIHISSMLYAQLSLLSQSLEYLLLDWELLQYNTRSYLSYSLFDSAPSIEPCNCSIWRKERRKVWREGGREGRSRERGREEETEGTHKFIKNIYIASYMYS